MKKIIPILSLFLLLLPITSFSQFGKYEVRERNDGRMDLINSSTQKAKYKRCEMISPIVGHFPNTDESYKNYALIKKGNRLIIFDLVNDVELENLKRVKDIEFTEIPDITTRKSLISSDSIQVEKKKNVIKGTLSSNNYEINRMTFAFNVVTGETDGVHHYMLDYRYDKFRNYVIYTAANYYLLRNENLENLFPIMADLVQTNDGTFVGTILETYLAGVLDKDLNEILPFEYCNLTYLSDDALVATNQEENVGVITFQGNTLIPFIYSCYHHKYYRDKGCGCRETVSELAPNLHVIIGGGTRALIDNQGKYVVPPGKYSSFKIFDDTLLWAYADSKNFGVYNIIHQKEVVPPLYQWAKTQEEFMICGKDKRTGIVSLLNGEVIAPFIYDTEYTEIKTKDNWRHFILETEGRKGVISITGEIKVPFIYDKIERVDNFLLVKEKGLYGLYDLTTFEQMLPTEFSEIDVQRKRVEKHEGEKLVRGRFTEECEVIWEE